MAEIGPAGAGVPGCFPRVWRWTNAALRGAALAEVGPLLPIQACRKGTGHTEPVIP